MGGPFWPCSVLFERVSLSDAPAAVSIDGNSCWAWWRDRCSVGSIWPCAWHMMTSLTLFLTGVRTGPGQGYGILVFPGELPYNT